VAVVTDGTAVLGLGDIGPAAAMPVMEGKAVLFKQFGGVDAIPICLATTDVEEIIETVVRLAPSFGGINLEDISAPRCFEIERRLKELLDIPVFHDDQHGTAVVALAALQNALRLTGRSASGTRVVIQGAGAAGVAVARILLEAGVRDLAVLDRQGVLHAGRQDLTPVKRALAAETADVFGRSGGLIDVMAGADVYIGVSGGTVPEEIVASMADEAIIFGLANPNPEVHPDVAHRHARVVATGRSDFPNQINNVLAFPGIFRGAFDVHATAITEGMKLAAADALAALVGDDLAEDMVIPSPFDPRVGPAVATAVAEAARRDGVARR
jgi:malate dehydrogenase (oxaloacetate-decarboxylating)